MFVGSKKLSCSPTPTQVTPSFSVTPPRSTSSNNLSFNSTTPRGRAPSTSPIDDASSPRIIEIFNFLETQVDQFQTNELKSEFLKKFPGINTHKEIIVFFNSLYVDGTLSDEAYSAFIQSLVQIANVTKPKSSTATSLSDQLSFLLHNLEAQIKKIEPEEEEEEKMIITKMHSNQDLFFLLIELFQQHASTTYFGAENLYARMIKHRLSEARINNVHLDAIELRLSNQPGLWETLKKLLSIATACFYKELLSLELFIGCLQGLDPYITNISQLSNPEHQPLRRERSRDILVILNDNLPLFSYSPPPEEQDTATLSLRIKLQREADFAAWEARTNKQKEQNKTVMHLLGGGNQSDTRFCDLLQTYITVVNPIIADSSSQKFLDSDCHIEIENSFPVLYYQYNSAFQETVSSASSVPETISGYIKESKIADESPVSLNLIKFADEFAYDNFSSTFIHNFLTGSMEETDFIQFLKQHLLFFSKSTPSSYDFSKTYSFFMVLTKYTEQLCPSLDDDAENFKEQIEEAESERKQRAKSYLKIETDSLCECYATILSNTPLEAKSNQEINSKLEVVFRLCADKKTFRERLTSAANKASTNEEIVLNKVQSTLGGQIALIYSNPELRHSTAIIATSALFQPATKSPALIIKSSFEIAKEKLENLNPTTDTMNDVIIAITDSLNSLQNPIQTEISEILTLIDGIFRPVTPQATATNPASSDTKSKKSKGGWRFASIFSSSKSQISPESDARMAMIKVLAKDDECCTALAQLLIQPPDFYTESPIRNSKKYKDTIFAILYTENSEFKKICNDALNLVLNQRIKDSGLDF